MFFPEINHIMTYRGAPDLKFCSLCGLAKVLRRDGLHILSSHDYNAVQFILFPDDDTQVQSFDQLSQNEIQNRNLV